MSNPLDASAGTGAVVGTVGGPTSFFDNFQATLQEAATNESWLGFEGEVRSRWDDSLKQLQAKTGLATAVNDPTPLVEDLIDPNKERWITRAFLGVDDTSAERQAMFQAARDANARVTALGDPSIPSLEQIIEEVKNNRGVRAENAAQVAEASGAFGGFFGRLAGGVTAALADPAQLPTLLAGGVGKTAAMRIGTEIAANAAVGGAVQSQLVNPQHRLLGEEEGSVAEAALYGGLAAGVIRGGAEGLGVLASRALDRATPEVSFDFADDQLRQMFQAAPENPQARAGLALLDQQTHIDSSISYVETDAGYRRFTGEVGDIWGSVTGRTDTAIARLLPPIESFTLENLDFHTQVVREQTPEVFSRLEAASGRVAELDAQIVDAQGRLDNLTVGDALAKIDEDTGNLVQAYEAELQQPNLSAADRAALEQKIAGIVESVQARPQTPDLAAAEARLAAATTKAERLAAARDLDKLYKSVGEDQLAKAVDSVEIPLKKELQALRASRKAAAKEFRASRAAMDQRIAEVKAEERVKQLLQPQRGTSLERGEFDVEGMRPDRVEAQAKAVDEAHEGLEAQKEAPLPPPDDKGMIDFGDGVLVDKNFVVSDPLTGEPSTAGKVYADLQDDQALLEAMRTCAL